MWQGMQKARGLECELRWRRGIQEISFSDWSSAFLFDSAATGFSSEKHFVPNKNLIIELVSKWKKMFYGEEKKCQSFPR